MNFTPARSLKRQVLGVDRFPALGEARLQLAAAGVELGQRLGDVLQDDAADVGARGHAGLDDVELLAEHDAHALLLGERARANAVPESSVAMRVRVVRFDGIIGFLRWTAFSTASPASARQVLGVRIH